MDITPLPNPAETDVVFVIGLHKSGTSLLTQHLSRWFFDTSRETNPFERGYGTALPRYLTRECSIVRQINGEFRAADVPQRAPVIYLRNAMTAYLESWRRPIVLKAPYFAYSLSEWIAAAEGAGLTPCVCCTHRNLRDTVAAWGKAPYTSSLLEIGELDRLRFLLRVQVDSALASDVDVRHFTFEMVRAL